MKTKIRSFSLLAAVLLLCFSFAIIGCGGGGGGGEGGKDNGVGPASSGLTSDEEIKAEIKNGFAEIDGVSIKLDVPDDCAMFSKRKADDYEESLGAVGDVYKISSNINCTKPVTITMPLQKVSANEVLQLLIFADNRGTELMPVYNVPEINGNTMTFTFSPSELKNSFSSSRGRSTHLRRAKKANGLDLEFCQVKLYYFFDKSNIKSKHFKMYLPFKDVGKASKEPAFLEHYEKIAKMLEDAYDYYYKTLKYVCKKDDYFPMGVYFDSKMTDLGLFESGIRSSYIRLGGKAATGFESIGNISERIKKMFYDDIEETVFHELFHAVQYGYGHSIKWTISPFWEASATYYEVKYKDLVSSSNFEVFIFYAFNSLFGNIAISDWYKQSENQVYLGEGYGRAGLIHYVSQKKKSDDWIKKVLEEGSSVDAMKTVLSDYSAWAEDYYRSLCMGKVPCYMNNAPYSAAVIRNFARKGKCGKALKLKAPSEYDLRQYVHSGSTTPFKLDNAEVQLNINGKAAQVAAIEIEKGELKKLLAASAKPSIGSLQLNFTVDGGKFKTTVIKICPENVAKITGMSAPLDETLATCSLELLVYSDEKIDTAKTATVKVGLTAESMLYFDWDNNRKSFTFDGTNYTKNGSPVPKQLIIPGTYKGKPVTHVLYRFGGGEDLKTDKKHFESVVMHEGITHIESPAFEGCKKLKSVKLPKSLQHVGVAVFQGCDKLASIEFGDKVTDIDFLAFNGCSGLKTIKIGSGLATIKSNAFDGCTGLTSITVSEDNNKYKGHNCLIEKDTETLILGCNSGTIPDGTEIIGENAFNGRTGITSLTIPDSVTEIEDMNVFEGCINLEKTITFKGSITQWNNISGNKCFPNQVEIVHCLSDNKYCKIAAGKECDVNGNLISDEQ